MWRRHRLSSRMTTEKIKPAISGENRRSSLPVPTHALPNFGFAFGNMGNQLSNTQPNSLGHQMKAVNTNRLSIGRSASRGAHHQGGGRLGLAGGGRQAKTAKTMKEACNQSVTTSLYDNSSNVQDNELVTSNEAAKRDRTDSHPEPGENVKGSKQQKPTEVDNAEPSLKDKDGHATNLGELLIENSKMLINIQIITKHGDENPRT